MHVKSRLALKILSNTAGYFTQLMLQRRSRKLQDHIMNIGQSFNRHSDHKSVFNKKVISPLILYLNKVAVTEKVYPEHRDTADGRKVNQSGGN
jgi:hypothetical protein